MAHSILRRSQIETKIGLSRSSIYDRINPKSPYYDPTFPKPISLGGSSVGWLESEIDEWIASRIAQSRTVTSDTALTGDLNDAASTLDVQP